jgi:hypothetical protein
MAETAADAVGVRGAAADATGDVAGAVDVRAAVVVAADGIEADVAGLAAGDTRDFFATDLHG